VTGSRSQSTVPVLSGDGGLIRALGAWGLAAAIANIVIGGGIFVLPSAMARSVGVSAPLYYLACAAAVGAVALCFAEAGSRVSVSGGVAGGVEVAFGPYAGFMTAAMLWLAAVLASAGISAAIADALARVLPMFLKPVWRASFLLLLVGTLAAVNIGGVRAGGRLVGVTIVFKLAPLLVLLVVGALHGSRWNLTHGSPEHAHVGRAMLLGVFAFMGMETALGVSGEVKRPNRNVPLAILGALAAITVLYVAIQLAAQSLLGPALAQSATPLADAVGRVSPALSALLLSGAIVSMLGYLSSDMLSAPRILFRMASDGLLPPALAWVHPVSRAPAVAILVHAGLIIFLAISGAFAELVILSTLVTLLAYMGGCLAAVALQRRGIATVGAPLDFKATPLAAGIAMVWIAAQGTWRECLAVLVAVALASLVYLASARRRRRAASRADLRDGASL
jgi:amino acid transporter